MNHKDIARDMNEGKYYTTYCSYCGRKFTPSSDIVGDTDYAKYHRKCYEIYWNKIKDSGCGCYHDQRVLKKN